LFRSSNLNFAIDFEPLNNNIQIALVGNPNCGKSSLFNELTGLRQKVGNFPGVTVDKKTGICVLNPTLSIEITDLPGTYSLYPRRADEWVAYKELLEQQEHLKPQMILLVIDASNLRRNLLFCSQIIDLKIPVVVATTMNDLAKEKGIKIDIGGLERELGVPIVPINPRKQKGIETLKKVIERTVVQHVQPSRSEFIYNYMLAPDAIREAKQLLNINQDYTALHHLIHAQDLIQEPNLANEVLKIGEKYKFNATKTQAEEIMQRYARIRHIMQQNVVETDPLKKSLLTEKLDNILLHKRYGYAIMMLVLFVLFQSVFWLSQYPMNAIEWSFAQLIAMLDQSIPHNWFGNLINNGILAGLSGILIFIPQIMILFGLIGLLEDSGYMARISFLTDRIMRKMGLNGKSVMPMISGFACAVPAIMSARNIENRKERLITILITPFMSCSARLPVFTILIALVIPNTYYFGFIALQGLVMMFLYLFGLFIALISAWILKWLVKSKERSFFILELPTYRSPRWKNILLTMLEKAKIFALDAGKIIMIISLMLWVLSNYGPGNKMEEIKSTYTIKMNALPKEKQLDLEREEKTLLLENSYAGRIGKFIEPAIAPLGYDWKIGIALVTSFAAREVFVGTMATLYSVDENEGENNTTLREKMSAATNAKGEKIYTMATGVSLMIFYLLAMQCMSTLAVVKRETKSWKWPLIQLLYMSGLAYVFSFIAYQLLS
jgi:ferrous iron transport protein B